MLLEDWHAIAYDSTSNPKDLKKIWDKYFKEEKEIYKIILKNPDKEIVGTVKDLASEFNMDITYFTGFLEGINDSLIKPNPIDKLKDQSKVKIKIDKEKLYLNMLKNKADWLYKLDEWDDILSKEKRDEIRKEYQDSLIVKREGAKIYPNDPCPCGSGKKYKKCCGKNEA